MSYQFTEGVFVLAYKVLSGNEEFAKGTQRAAAQRGSRVIPVYFNPAVDEMSIAIYDGDELIKGPYPITPTWGADIKKVADALGWMPFQTQEPPTPPSVTPPPKKVAKVEPPAPVALTLDQVTAKIRDAGKKTAHSFLEIGKWLLEAKRLIGHGNWMEYLEQEVKLTQRYAQTFMRLYEEFGSNPQALADLGITQLGLILDAPPEARPALIHVARTQPTRVLAKAVRLLRRTVAKAPEWPIEPEPSPPDVPPIGRVIIHLANEPKTIPTYTDQVPEPTPPVVIESLPPEPVVVQPTPELTPDPAPPEVVVPPSQPVAPVEVAIEVLPIEPVQATPTKQAAVRSAATSEPEVPSLMRTITLVERTVVQAILDMKAIKAHGESDYCEYGRIYTLVRDLRELSGLFDAVYQEHNKLPTVEVRKNG